MHPDIQFKKTSAPLHVTVFIQCLVGGFCPEVGIFMVRILEKLGVPLDYAPTQTCCGQPAFNAGYRKEARRAARHFIEVFEDAAWIVCPSGSCTHMVREYYPLLFETAPQWHQRAVRVSRKVFEFTITTEKYKSAAVERIGDPILQKADIEATLVHGAHGPRRVGLFVIAET